MSPGIGLDQYTLAHRGWDALATLRFAASHRFDGVQFPDAARIDAALDTGALRAARALARELGLNLQAGLPCPNPVRRSREAAGPIDTADMVAILRPHLDALVELECTHARIYIGDRHDRFRTDVAWADQIAATLAVIERLTPMLKERGIRLAIETHADLTVAELLDVIARIDPEVAGVTLDTGNLVMRLDDPLEAVNDLGPHVIASHIKDMVLARTARGLCWQARPVGSGILPMTEILDTVLRARPDIMLSIELHPRIYDLPIDDPAWLAFFPGLRADSLNAVVRLADQCEERYDAGTLERPETVEAIPWVDRDLAWLASSLGYLRTVVPTLIETARETRAGDSPSASSETVRHP